VNKRSGQKEIKDKDSTEMDYWAFEADRDIYSGLLGLQHSRGCTLAENISSRSC
jgi:hypothetical protein